MVRRPPNAVRSAARPLLALGLSALLAACWGDDAYIVEGTVIDVMPSGQLVVDHEDVPGLMPAMVMPFKVKHPSLSEGIVRGNRIIGRLRVTRQGTYLEKIRVTGSVPLPDNEGPDGPGPVRPGTPLVRTEIPVNGGDTWVVGQGQPRPTALTFLYTTCPLPEYCPLVVTRLQALQEAVGDKAQLVAVTIDPKNDTLEVLGAFADKAGAKPDVWRFGRLEGQAFLDLVMRAGLPLALEEGEVVHALRLLVLDAGGTLLERYDDNAWPLDRVVQQLTTGGPPAPPGSDGTISRPHSD